MHNATDGCLELGQMMLLEQKHNRTEFIRQVKKQNNINTIIRRKPLGGIQIRSIIDLALRASLAI